MISLYLIIIASQRPVTVSYTLSEPPGSPCSPLLSSPITRASVFSAVQHPPSPKPSPKPVPKSFLVTPPHDHVAGTPHTPDELRKIFPGHTFIRLDVGGAQNTGCYALEDDLTGEKIFVKQQSPKKMKDCEEAMTIADMTCINWPDTFPVSPRYGRFQIPREGQSVYYETFPFIPSAVTFHQLLRTLVANNKQIFPNRTSIDLSAGWDTMDLLAEKIGSGLAQLHNYLAQHAHFLPTGTRRWFLGDFHPGNILATLSTDTTPEGHSIDIEISDMKYYVSDLDKLSIYFTKHNLDPLVAHIMNEARAFQGVPEEMKERYVKIQRSWFIYAYRRVMLRILGNYLRDLQDWSSIGAPYHGIAARRLAAWTTLKETYDHVDDMVHPGLTKTFHELTKEIEYLGIQARQNAFLDRLENAGKIA